MKIFTRSVSALLALLWTFPVMAQEYNYAEVLQKSILFYETQQSGKLPEWNRISWRSDAGFTDGQDVGLDLTGGWFDAGDHIKFGLPMAFSVTALNWGFLEYQQGYQQANQVAHFKRNIKWVTDYFIKCHPSPNEFYAQVSAKTPDHSFWMPAEMVDYKYERLSYKLDAANPGTDVACETAAALASASMVFKESDPAYSAQLLTHAKQLFEFGDTYRGRYTDEGNIPAVGTYSSGGFNDELTWGAIWLYKATGDEAYLDKARALYEDLSLQSQSTYKSYKWSLVWDDKSYGCYVLMADITGEQQYKDDAERHLDWWTSGFEGDRVGYSPGGLAWLFQWGSLRHAANAALTALIYSDNVDTPNKEKYHDFAVSQINYMLGDNPENRSYVTGFGNNPPTKPHHRGQHSSWLRSEKVPEESRHTLWGALVGGPKIDDSYTDDRTDFQLNEVACDYNAGFQGVIAGLVQEYGGTPLANFPQPETPGVEFVNEVRINGESGAYTEVAVWLNNRSGWPARKPDDMRFRYYFDIAEGLDAGYTAEDYQVTVRNGTQVGGVTACGGTTYYVEAQLDGEIPIPAGQESYRKEVQMRIALPATAPAGAWDASNDPSYQGLTEDLAERTNVPMFVDGELAWGELPCDGGSPNPTPDRAPVADFTVTPATGTAPLEVAVDASAASDPDGDPLTYAWNFGDGTTATGVTASHEYETAGTYDIKLTVSAKGKSDSKTIAIDVEEGTQRPEPVARITTDKVSGKAPLTVRFSGEESTNPSDGALTYAWDFDNGETATTATATTTYNTPGTYEAVLTVTNAAGSDRTTITVTVTEPGTTPGNDCAFGTPRNSALPTLHTSYKNIYVLGEGGPNLDNVSDFTVNWSLENKGLYQFSMNTTDGKPGYWNDFLPKVTHTFSAAEPSIVLENTGFPRLDGAYYATIEGDNFVLVSQAGGFTIYFSNEATPPACSGEGIVANPIVGRTGIEARVFPNPASRELSVRSRESLRNAKVTLSNPSGATVRSASVLQDTRQYTLDVDNLPAGIYVLRITTPETEPQMMKVLVE